MEQSMKNSLLQFLCKINEKKLIYLSLICFSDGEEDEDDEGISERSLRRTPSDDGKEEFFCFFCMRKNIFSNLYSISRF